METQTKSVKLINLEKIEPNQIVEISKWEKIQEQIILDNPFIEITDTATYNQAKSNRTALLKGKTSLLGPNGQESIIRSALKNILTGSISILESLANKTIPHYDKQQDEIKRYEGLIEERRLEREQKAEEERLIEQKRIENINNQIEQIYQIEKSKVDSLTFDGIESLKMDWDSNLKKTNTVQFDEFEVTFYKTLERLGVILNEKVDTLTITENQRLEAIKLAEERKQFEAEKEKSREIERKNQAKINAANKIKSDELAKKEAEIKAEQDRLAEIEKQRLEKIRLAEIEKQRLEAEKERVRLEKENAKRLKALQPDKDKALDIINSLIITNRFIDINDKSVITIVNDFVCEVENLKTQFTKAIQDLT